MVTLAKSKVLATTSVRDMPASEVRARWVADGRTADVSTGERQAVFARSAGEALMELAYRQRVAQFAAKK